MLTAVLGDGDGSVPWLKGAMGGWQCPKARMSHVVPSRPSPAWQAASAMSQVLMWEQGDGALLCACGGRREGGALLGELGPHGAHRSVGKGLFQGTFCFPSPFPTSWRLFLGGAAVISLSSYRLSWQTEGKLTEPVKPVWSAAFLPPASTSSWPLCTGRMLSPHSCSCASCPSCTTQCCAICPLWWSSAVGLSLAAAQQLMPALGKRSRAARVL